MDRIPLVATTLLAALMLLGGVVYFVSSPPSAPPPEPSSEPAVERRSADPTPTAARAEAVDFPPEHAPDAFPAVVAQWRAACPAVEEAVVELEDCSIYPCMGRVSWMRSAATSEAIWCDASTRELLGQRESMSVNVSEDDAIEHVIFTFGAPNPDPDTHSRRHFQIVRSLFQRKTL